MPERPLLIFPDRDEEARQKMSAGYGRISKPDHATQVTRLDNRFTAFQQVMENRMAEFRLNPSGIEPEEVLVIEVAGNVTQFLSVCRNTEGIEWMGDIEADGLVEDELFYSGEEFSEGKPLNGRLLLSMTNQTGIRNLLTMWENWKENEDYDYPYGLNGWKKIFPSIINIRRWGVQERFEETGVQDNWEFELQHGKDRISFELELWYRKPEELREESQLNVEELVNELDGEILNILDISEIRYHGLLVELPNRSIRELLADQDVSLVRCDQIMFFRPTGQSVPKVEVEDEEDREELEIEESVLGTEDYEMAVFDGLPIQNHNALRDYLIVDDPENFEEGYPVLKREHGTSISSIVIKLAI
ncbi:MAG: hypothetical protein U5K69_26335 [Balneolaceae bacterium]|nr:hypothetical protein [Balneolaceae bacterium]